MYMQLEDKYYVLHRLQLGINLKCTKMHEIMDATLKLPSFLQDQRELTGKFSQTNVTYHLVPHVI